jgi:hypothetical protein
MAHFKRTIEYLELLKAAITARRLKNEALEDSICEQMDALWLKMSKNERVMANCAVKVLSEDQ